LGPADVPLLERLLLDSAERPSEVVYADVLPQLSPTYGALRDLGSSDVDVRRRGAQQLAQQAQSGSLSPLAVRRLSERLLHEQDRLVWRYATNAVLADASDECARIAELAANHVWPDIRMLGCDYAARHGRPQFAAWLLPLLHDRDRNVQMAAVQAAGRCSHPLLLDGTPSGAVPLPGLRPLLTHADERLRTAAAISMSRLGDPQAMQELVRLSFQSTAAVREQAVAAMGVSGQTRFIEHLVRLGWTEPNAGVQRAILTSLEQLTPAHERPAELAAHPASDARLRIWMAWWQQRQGEARRDERGALSG
jgi:hypothetical protein